MKKYTQHNNFSKENNSHNWGGGCNYCHGTFEEDEKFIRIDVQVTNFRGDDDVYCFHKQCLVEGKKEIKEINIC